jgi:hypothetical protein
MKYIKTYEKYKHTNQDKEDDMYYINKFSKKFEDEFEFRLNFDIKEDVKFMDYIGYGAEKIYSGKIKINNNNVSYLIWIYTRINPNGIEHSQDIGRIFTIKMKIRIKEYPVTNYYEYSRNIDDILEKFDRYILKELNIEYLTDQEKEKRKKEKELKISVNKYNL